MYCAVASWEMSGGWRRFLFWSRFSSGEGSCSGRALRGCRTSAREEKLPWTQAGDSLKKSRKKFKNFRNPKTNQRLEDEDREKNRLDTAASMPIWTGNANGSRKLSLQARKKVSAYLINVARSEHQNWDLQWQCAAAAHCGQWQNSNENHSQTLRVAVAVWRESYMVFLIPCPFSGCFGLI